MQLTVEAETNLDIKRNSMSTDENIQSNIVENLDIDNFKTKCNGNKEIGVNQSEDEDRTQGKEIEEALANIPMGEENCEAELSNVDLSKSKQSCLENENAISNESQDSDSEIKLNGLDSSEKDIISKPGNDDDDDDLEDDIISLSEEPFQILAEPVNENGITVDNVTISEESLKTDKINNVEEMTATSAIGNNVSLIEEDDVIELIEESENVAMPLEEVQESLIQKINNDIEVIEEIEEAPVQNDKEVDLQINEDEEISGDIEESLEKCYNKSEQTIVEEKDDIEIIEEHTAVQSEADLSVQNEKSEIVFEAETRNSPIPRETETLLEFEDKEVDVALESTDSHKNEPLMESSKEGDLNHQSDEENNGESKIVFEAEDINAQCENRNSIEKNRKDETEVEMEAVQTVNSYEKESDSKIEQKEHDSKLKVKESDSKIEEKDEVEIVDDAEMPSIECHNKTDMEVEQTIDSHVTDELKPNIDEKSQEVNFVPTESERVSVDKITNIDKTDSPIMFKDDIMEVDDVVEKPKQNRDTTDSITDLKDDMDVEEVIDKIKTIETVTTEVKETCPSAITNGSANNVANNATVKSVDKQIVCKLSNTLDILSDDDDAEEPPRSETSSKVETTKEETLKADSNEKQCIDIDDDDDIMLITDGPTDQVEKNVTVESTNTEETPASPPTELKKDAETNESTDQQSNNVLDKPVQDETSTTPTSGGKNSSLDININEKITETTIDQPERPPQLIPDNFLKTAKKKLADMTRDELEEFCVLKIVESIVDRSSLGEIKNKIKLMSQGLDEYRKKAMMLAKQNRDLQVVMKSIQEEQKKVDRDKPIYPLKITRSVGMQVIMEKAPPKKKVVQQQNTNKNTNTPNRNTTSQAPRLPQKANQPIPVPRLVPANNPVLKSPSNPQINQMNVIKNNPPNGMVKTPSPNLKAEKRPFNKIASPNSITVDLTDDEPPAKLPGGPKCSPAPPVRIVPPQALIAPQRSPFAPTVNNSPRKVYIPISGPPNQALRTAQTIMLKTVPASSIRPRVVPPPSARIEPNSVRMRVPNARHPAPLPVAPKQFQPPNWKPLPPSPDLKLSKVDNGIVISWKVENPSGEPFEEIASYQLYAYQETSTPPSTNLWKKIGDVKALPLPMACTLTQFIAGFKYYFAVRAVDVRSRIGPFSLPGSILLLNKSI